jgi:hypothetical protein
MLIMAVLSLIGVAVITNSAIELRITGSQRVGKLNFYTADGANQLLITRIAAAGDTVGDVPNVEQALQTLAPNANEPADPNMPGWAVVQAGTVPPWGGQAQPFDYNYRMLYLRRGSPPKGYSASTFSGFFYEVDTLAGQRGVQTVNMRIGPR